MEYDTSYPKEGTTDDRHNVWIEWNQPNMPWNEICAMVIEVFGLPGERYTYSTSMYCMLLRFRSLKDKTLCEIFLSEFIVC